MIHVLGKYGNSNLGFTASQKRNVKPGYEFNSFFAEPTVGEVVLNQNGSTYDTLEYIKQKASKDAHQAQKIAAHLKDSTTEKTLKNIWNFMYDHFQYKEDPVNREQIKSLYASWKNRYTGIDCDDYAVAIGKILNNLDIPFYIKKIRQETAKSWHHVYIIVPKTERANIKNRNNYWVIDPVVNQFDKEPDAIAETHEIMGQITYLNGLGSEKSDAKKESAQKNLLVIINTLELDLKMMGENPKLYQTLHGNKLDEYKKLVEIFLKGCKDKYNNLNGVNRSIITTAFFAADKSSRAFVDVQAVKDLGLNPNDVGIFDTIRKTEAFTDIASATLNKRLSGTLSGFLRGNPVMVLLRTGVLFGVQLNLPWRHFIAAKLFPATIGYKKAIRFGYNPTQITNAKNTLEKILKTYAQIGGEPDKLIEAIKKGWALNVKNGHVTIAAQATDRVNANNTPANNNANTNMSMGNLGNLGILAESAIVTATAFLGALAVLSDSLSANPIIQSQFPTKDDGSPTKGEEKVENGKIYTFDGKEWILNTTTNTEGDIKVIEGLTYVYTNGQWQLQLPTETSGNGGISTAAIGGIVGAALLLGLALTGKPKTKPNLGNTTTKSDNTKIVHAHI